MGWDRDLLSRTRSNAVSKSPKWTITDLAARWGMSTHELSHLRRKFPGFPEVEFRHNSTQTTGKRIYYDLHKAMAWYKTVKNNSCPKETSSAIMNT